MCVAWSLGADYLPYQDWEKVHWIGGWRAATLPCNWAGDSWLPACRILCDGLCCLMCGVVITPRWQA